jgi:hypothetical protein
VVLPASAAVAGGRDEMVFEVWLQDHRDPDGAVFLLVVFEDGCQGPPYGQAAAVQGMDQAALVGVAGPVTDGAATGLKVQKIAAGGDLPVWAGIQTSMS